MNHMKLRALCEGAVLVAVAEILSFIKLWEMPWGGSIVLSMIPLVLYAVRWGLGAGLLSGFVFGVLQFVFDGGFAIGWQSIIGDYLLSSQHTGSERASLSMSPLFSPQYFSYIFSRHVGEGFATFLKKYRISVL